MPLSRFFAAGLWLAVTIASTAMVWAATSLVAADVTDRPAAVLAPADVVSALAAGSSPAMTAPGAPRVQGTTSTVPSPGRGSATTTARGVLSPPGSQAPQPSATITPASPLATSTTVPGAPPSTRPAGPPTTQRTSRPTATYSTPGGVVVVACSGVLIELVSAIPTDGYAVSVIAGGPANVDVHFVRAGQDLSVKAVCFGQPIRYDDQRPLWPLTGS